MIRARITVSGFLVVAVLLGPARLIGDGEIPAFARKYRVSCNMCHNPVPAMTEFGNTFAGNGFRFASGEPPRDTINTGDELLDLAASLPLAIRIDLYAQGITNGDVGTDWKTPYNIKLMSGGTLSKKLSYYLYFFLFERGEVGGLEDAYIHYNNIADAEVDVMLGQFQVSDPMFKREVRLSFQDYVIYRTEVGLQPADLTYDRGIMVPATFAGITVTGQIINGNGKGEAQEDLRLDNNFAKNFFGHVTGDVAPWLRLGAMGYAGRETGAVGDAPQVTNKLWMIGADATLSLGAFEINAQYIHRQDDRPNFSATDEVAKTNGGFAEVIWRHHQGRWYALALYNRIDCNQPLLNVRLGGPANLKRYQTITGGLGYVLRRNFRLLGEATWDTEREAALWTLGLVTAF
jgi:hypothetical protein